MILDDEDFKHCGLNKWGIDAEKELVDRPKRSFKCFLEDWEIAILEEHSTVNNLRLTN